MYARAMISRLAASICWTTRGSRSSFALRLLDGQFLVDQALQHRLLAASGLFGLEARLALQQRS